MRSLAELTYLRAGRIVLASVGVLLVALPFAVTVFDRVEPFDISDPSSEVERAYAAYEAATGRRSEPEVLLLVRPDGGASSPAGRRLVGQVSRKLARVDGIAAVSTPADHPAQLSRDRRAAIVIGFPAAGAGRVETGERVADTFAGDPEVLAGGIAVAAHQIGVQTEQDTRRIELYAAPLLLLLLFAVFRSPLAAALPLALAGFSIVVTLAILVAISGAIDIDLFSLQVVTGLGVGLAIDYSLFVLARFRVEIRRGDGYAVAQRRTVATAGRTIAFGSLTVAAALAALILFPQQFLSSTGVAGGLVALLSGVAALLVLPALLALLGPRVDPGFESAPAAGKAPPDPLSGGSRFWEGLSRRVLRRPVPVATLALVVMIAIGSPAFGGELTAPDGRVLPESKSAKLVYDASPRFPRLPANRISVLVPPGAGRDSIAAARTELEGLGGVERVSALRRLPDRAGYVTISSPLDPVSDRGQELLKRVRAAAWPAGTLVGGRAAELADQRSSIADSAPIVIALVVATNLLLVLLTTRSLVLPLVSIGLNALTVLASYGIMVALFEHSRTAELLGTVTQQGVDISVPILAFAVVFGLSTDYGIFLFSRIAEARRDGLGESEAITAGLSRSGRLITSAAVIFSVAVGANVFSDLVIVKEFAVAVAVAVLLDATIVRGLLVPAVLRLLGARAWWLPGAGPARSGRRLSDGAAVE